MKPPAGETVEGERITKPRARGTGVKENGNREVNKISVLKALWGSREIIKSRACSAFYVQSHERFLSLNG